MPYGVSRVWISHGKNNIVVFCFSAIRFYLEKDENNSYFNAQFPVPPLMTFHWEVYEQCSKDFLTCLQYLHGVVSETQLQVI